MSDEEKKFFLFAKGLLEAGFEGRALTDRVKDFLSKNYPNSQEESPSKKVFKELLETLRKGQSYTLDKACD